MSLGGPRCGPLLQVTTQPYYACGLCSVGGPSEVSAWIRTRHKLLRPHQSRSALATTVAALLGIGTFLQLTGGCSSSARENAHTISIHLTLTVSDSRPQHTNYSAFQHIHTSTQLHIMHERWSRGSLPPATATIAWPTQLSRRFPGRRRRRHRRVHIFVRSLAEAHPRLWARLLGAQLRCHCQCRRKLVLVALQLCACASRRHLA